MPTTTTTTSYIIKQHNAHSAKKEEFIKSSSAYAPHDRALKRFQNKGAKPSHKRKLQIYYKTAKSLKILLTHDIIKSQKGAKTYEKI